MKLHRFFVSPDSELKQDFWLRDAMILNQWNKVLRFRIGQEVVLFDGEQHDRLYKLIELNSTEAHLKLITEFKRKLPSLDIYLLWALLKKDKNDWVLQKCTELGVSHFVPIITERTEKTGFDSERARKIIVEAAEQCGRSDIPTIREPMKISHLFTHKIAKDLQFLVCEQGGDMGNPSLDYSKPIAILIGPEGGWSDAEKQLFKDEKIAHLNLHDFTLRAETAAVAATAKLVQ